MNTARTRLVKTRRSLTAGSGGWNRSLTTAEWTVGGGRKAPGGSDSTLLTWVERLPELAAHPHDALPSSHRIQTFSSDLDQHLETMQTVILPAVHTRLSECGLGLLARSLDRSRPQHAACTPDHSPENGHNA